MSTGENIRLIARAPWKISKKLIFLKTVEALAIILT